MEDNSLPIPPDFRRRTYGKYVESADYQNLKSIMTYGPNRSHEQHYVNGPEYTTETTKSSSVSHRRHYYLLPLDGGPEIYTYSTVISNRKKKYLHVGGPLHGKTVVPGNPDYIACDTWRRTPHFEKNFFIWKDITK